MSIFVLNFRPLDFVPDLYFFPFLLSRIVGAIFIIIHNGLRITEHVMARSHEKHGGGFNMTRYEELNPTDIANRWEVRRSNRAMHVFDEFAGIIGWACVVPVIVIGARILTRGNPTSYVQFAVPMFSFAVLIRLLEWTLLPSNVIAFNLAPNFSVDSIEDRREFDQVSAMYVQLATDVEDPIKRLEKIQLNTMVGKLYQDAIDAKSLMGYAELIPFGLAGVAARFYSRAAIAKHHSPLFNVVITNVPGPQIPIYLAGHKLIVNMGTAPIFDGMGLIMPICSYNGTLSISPTSSANLMPDFKNMSANSLSIFFKCVSTAILNFFWDFIISSHNSIVCFLSNENTGSRKM